MRCKICGKNINNPTKYFSVKDRAHLHWLSKHRKTHRPKANLFQEYFEEATEGSIKNGEGGFRKLRKLTRVEQYELAVHMSMELYPMDVEKRRKYVREKMEKTDSSYEPNIKKIDRMLKERYKDKDKVLRKREATES